MKMKKFLPLNLVVFLVSTAFNPTCAAQRLRKRLNTQKRETHVD